MARSLSAAALVLLLGTGCPRRPPPPAEPRPDPSEAVEALRLQVRDLLRRQAEALWQSWALGEDTSLAATYAGSEALFTDASIRLVRQASDRANDPDRRRALELLAFHLLAERVAREVVELEEARASVEASALVSAGGERFPYHDLARRLAMEPSAERRRAMTRAALEAVGELDPLLRREAAGVARAVATLGAGDVMDFAGRLHRADLPALKQAAEGFLTATEAPYRAAMAELARETLGLELADLSHADIPRLFARTPFDEAIPAERTVEVVRGATAALGLALAEERALRLDTTPRPRKNPLPLCVPVEPGRDVRISVGSLAGAAGLAALLHEAGHALYYARATAPYFEFVLLGDDVVPETWAFVFEDLLSEPEWIETQVGLSPERARALARRRRLERLYLARRYAGKLLFEYAWLSGEAADPKAAYAAQMSEAYGFPADPAAWATDAGVLFEDSAYLRAFWQAAAVEARLAAAARPGRWYASPATGAWLQRAWRRGNLGDVLIPDAEAARLAADALIRDLPGAPTEGGSTAR